MKKIIPGLLLVGSLLLSIYVIYVWFISSEYDTISLETKLLTAAVVLSILGLITVYYFQSKGYLNHRFINFSVFLFSIAFLLGASFLLYVSYDYYNKSLKIEASSGAIEIADVQNATLANGEARIYSDLKQSGGKLLGYETFLKETAQNYDPSAYSYANVLKAEYIEQLSKKAATQNYWDDILNSVYVFDTLNNSYKRGGYEIMYVFGKEEYPNEDLGNTTDKDVIRKTSILEYWQAQLINTDRSPEGMTSFWQNNKAFLYTFFSKSQYDTICKQVIDDLIAIKDEINQQPNYQEFYEKHDISDPIFLTFPDEKFVKSYAYTWPFSFWDRRFEEGNDAVIYEILKEIQFHYQS